MRGLDYIGGFKLKKYIAMFLFASVLVFNLAVVAEANPFIPPFDPMTMLFYKGLNDNGVMVTIICEAVDFQIEVWKNNVKYGPVYFESGPNIGETAGDIKNGTVYWR